MVELGLLPENLPPVFNTRSLWSPIAGTGQNYLVTEEVKGEHALYNASKRGGQRRLFHIPHPLFVRDQGVFFEKHWADIEKVYDTARGSVSRPQFNEGPRHVRITSHSDLPGLRLKALSKFKFCLVTDVARCFPSIYTHSIPWAINGKQRAKDDHRVQSASIFGNRLDFIVRQAQLKQTVGIPVGPDPSKLISEVVLAAVDADFLDRSSTPKPTYIRHVDDYWIAGNSYEECEKHLFNLRAALRKFELDTNEKKTQIVSTRMIISDDWPYEFDTQITQCFGSSSVSTNMKLSLIGKIVKWATENEDDGILRHTIRQLDEGKMWADDWDLLEHFLAQCAVQFPHSFDYVARVIAWRNRKGLDFDTNLWREVSLGVIQQHAPLARDFEVIWAMWLLKELNFPISQPHSDLIVENSNALPLSFLPHFCANRLATDATLLPKLRKRVSSNPLAGSLWPLTLEMTHLGVGDSKWMRDKLPNVAKSLHAQSVSIINWSAKPKVFGPLEGEGADEEDPSSAIESWSADYGVASGESDAVDGFPDSGVDF